MRGFVQRRIHWEDLVIFSFWSGILIWRWWCASHGAEEAKFRGQADAFRFFLLPSAHPKEFLLPIRFLGLGWDYSWHSHFLPHCEVWDSRAFSTFVPLLCLSQMMQMRREATVLKWLNWILWAQRDASLAYVQIETFFALRVKCTVSFYLIPTTSKYFKESSDYSPFTQFVGKFTAIVQCHFSMYCRLGWVAFVKKS